MNFNELVKQWDNKWGIPNPTNPNKESLKGQCVSLARYYMANVLEISLDGITGDAKDYWYRRNDEPLNKYFDSIEYYKGMEFKKGDIFVLRPVSDNPYGHIGLCFGESNESQMHIFDSNYKSKRTCYDRWRAYDGLLGVLRPKEYLQSKIIGSLEPMKWIAPYPTLKIDKETMKDGYPVRSQPMNKELVYTTKKGDYLSILEISSKPFDDGYKWAKVVNYGNEIGYIQVDLDYMHVEV
ncbi:SH3 domain-containing protein [Anaerorhabdus sp.]|uniref:SH3 domain-containing protein n=1 Tax=Anaerorhabdus sp. TaxID=1872524 RepID=UPI002FC74654